MQDVLAVYFGGNHCGGPMKLHYEYKVSLFTGGTTSCYHNMANTNLIKTKKEQKQKCKKELIYSIVSLLKQLT